MRSPSEYFKLEVTYRIPRMEEATVRKDLTYATRDGKPLLADVYHPANGSASLSPVVIFVHGDAAPEVLRDMKDSGQFVSWGKLAAASGLAAVTFNHRSSRRRAAMHEPADDVEALLDYVRDRGSGLGIDSTRLAIWVCSAGPPFVLPYLLRRMPGSVRGIAVYYGLLDVEHLRAETPSEVSDQTLREFSPVRQLQAAAGSVPPLLVVRAGLDHPRFNESIDRFVAAASALNLAIEFVNLPRAGHGFDVWSDTIEVRQVIQSTLDFLRRALASPEE